MFIYKKLVSFILYHNDFKYENKIKYINMGCDKIQEVAISFNKCIKTKSISLFIDLLQNKNVDPPLSISQFFKLLDEFISKLKEQIKNISKKNPNKNINKEKNGSLSIQSLKIQCSPKKISKRIINRAQIKIKIG